ncbi:helix-turn-helix transcriptional regulator [Streptomyces sp. LP05-1]|uniref:Helix-turn-helix transcriptional regulator n=1 Tax=Streptomyces pyxinae TaxID=2970734 RepID=A0ABT2CNA4_9ACTN|nr:helix-turn-helix transcriptional regulator [Streptomyces sp. LP05-1]MCS0638567.1 helix-turn-helix transcriptional regulator [Streptomyces sp. LP05-1]
MTTAGARTGVGPLLKAWRERRRLSQLELALRAESSARHISFVENGRSRPSEAMVLRLADRLDVPVRERNTLLLAAGYAPRYPETPLDDPALEPVREAIGRLLAGYEPYPALVLDGCYRVVAANEGITRLLDGVAGELLAPPLNAMRVMLHPRGLAPRIRNLPEWRGHLLEQLERRLGPGGPAELRALYEELSGYPVPGSADATDPVADPRPLAPAIALPLRIEHRGRLLSFVSSVSTFNTPMDVTVSELAVETFLPADAGTAALLRGPV